MALVEFKVKLELIVGVYTQDMKLELRGEDGRFLAELFGDDKTLEELGVKDKSIIHVKDTSGNSMGLDTGEGSAGNMSARYVMNDEKYDNRKDSVRQWMKELGVVKDSEVQLPEYVKVGNRCGVQVGDQPRKEGVIAYIGKTHFKSGIWVGIVYDQPVGKNDGSVDGQRYFICEPLHGSFVIPKSVLPALDG